MKIFSLLALCCVISSCSTSSSMPNTKGGSSVPKPAVELAQRDKPSFFSSLMGSAPKAQSADQYPQRNTPTSTADYEARAIVAINEYRVKQGLRPLYPDPRLREAAYKHSQDMYEHGRVTHDGSSLSNRNVVKRVKKEGIDFSYMAENVAGPNLATGGINHLNHTPERTISRFMQSPNHRVNILNREVRFIGVGYYNGFWTQLFSSPEQADIFYLP